MAEERRDGVDRGAEGVTEEGYDRDLDLRAIVGFTAALAITLIAVAALMWGIGLLIRHELRREDPPPPVLEEARTLRKPPPPLLQPSPPHDLEELRARDRAVLSGYGWVDRAAGRVRIPIERAMEIVAQEGLGAEPGAEATTGTEQGAEEPR